MNDIQLPFSAEAEEAVIGAVLIDPGTRSELELNASDFYFERHKWIWRAILKLEAKHLDPDFITISDELKSAGRLDDIGGPAYLMKLVNLVPSSLRAPQYALVVKDKARRRKAIQYAGDLASAAYNENGNFEEAVSEITLKLTETAHSSRGLVHISEVMNEVTEYVEYRAKNPNETWGIPTGFIDLDRATGGVSGTWYLAGPPGVGKSILMLQMIINAAKEHGKWGAIFSLEMSRLAQGLRAVSSLGQIPTRALRTGYLSDDDWTAFYKAITIAADLPIFICDEPRLTLDQFRSHMTRLKSQGKLDIYALDYLLMLEGGGNMNKIDRSEMLSKGVVGIAKSLDVPGITINSVTKEGQDAKHQKSTNIRGSGELIHNADLVIFISKVEGNDIYTKNMRVLEITKERDVEEVTEDIEIIKAETWPEFRDISYQKERK